MPVARATRAAFSGHRPLSGAMVTCFGIAIGAWWEVAEYLLDELPSVRVINPLGDTISDIAVDSAGALCAALIGVYALSACARQDTARGRARRSG